MAKQLTPEQKAGVAASNRRRAGIGMQQLQPIHRQVSGRGIVRVSAGVADLLDNPENVKDWDDEELRRGRRRDKHGGWAGRDPIVVPTNAYRELIRRETRKAEMTLGESLADGVRALAKIATNPRTEDKDVLKAVGMMMDRVMGKTPELIDLQVRTPLFLGILQGGIVPGPMLESPIIDADVVDDDPVLVDDDEQIIWED